MKTWHQINRKRIKLFRLQIINTAAKRAFFNLLHFYLRPIVNYRSIYVIDIFYNCPNYIF